MITIIASGIALQLVGCTIEQLKEQWKVLVVIGILIELGVAWSLVWYTVTSSGMTRYQWIEVVSFPILLWSLSLELHPRRNLSKSVLCQNGLDLQCSIYYEQIRIVLVASG